jgi:hypothetical protein
MTCEIGEVQRGVQELRGEAPHLLQAGTRLLTWLPRWRQGDWPRRPGGLQLWLRSGKLHLDLHLSAVLGQAAQVSQLLLRLRLRLPSLLLRGRQTWQLLLLLQGL